MRYGSEEDEDMPYHVIVAAGVAGVEICPGGVHQPLGKKQEERERREIVVDRLGYEHDAPTHDEIHGEGETRITPNGHNLVDRAAYGYRPKDGEDCPADNAAYDRDADGGVGAGYHDVYADVVKTAHDTTRMSWRKEMVDGAAEEHQEHACNEKDDAHGPLPA